MTLIERLWGNGNLYIQDGIYRADGRSWSARHDVRARGLVRGRRIDLERLFRHDPDNITSVDVTRREGLADASGWLFCGEGSHGSEGFFGRLDRHGCLVWVVYLEHFNPGVSISRERCHATFGSSSGLEVTVDLTDSRFGDPGCK